MAQSAKRTPSPEQPPLTGLEPTPEQMGYRGPQVCKLVGISYRQLDYWARTDLVRPSLADARGSGTQRSYSYRDLVRLKVIKNLLDSGVKLQAARKAIEYVRGDLGDDWASASLVLNGTDFSMSNAQGLLRSVNVTVTLDISVQQNRS